ncbi:MAG: DUF799 domain-containing protein [Candidatus Accumulibacter sp.]|nr:DUF799 domain-containing protein [Accumulibacter sp.]
MRAGRRAVLAMAAFLLTACAAKAPQRIDYTAFRESRPRSILVMPPVNLAPDEKAPTSFLATATMPLAESGYYVIPVTLSEETFKQNGMNVAEEAQNVDPGKLREIFGADAALYITVNRFGTSYRMLDSVVEAGASAKLVDIRNGRELWQGQVTMSQSSNQNNSSGLVGMLLSAAVNQISNTLTDRAHEVAGIANYRLLSAGYENGILYGPYSPKAGTDSNSH